MKKNLNLFISLITLSITAFLLIIAAFSWYVTNKDASVSGGFVSTEDDVYSFELEEGTYENETWNWAKKDEISFNDIAPGDVFFFRIKINSEDTKNFLAEFINIESQLQTEKLKVVDNKICFISGDKNIPLYALTNNEVKIGDKVLYSYDVETEQIILGEDFYIQNSFLFHSFDALPADDSRPTSEGTSLVDSTFEFSSMLDYFYFALEFKETNFLINNVECSNAYLFQKLVIGHISVHKQ